MFGLRPLLGLPVGLVVVTLTLAACGERGEGEASAEAEAEADNSSSSSTQETTSESGEEATSDGTEDTGPGADGTPVGMSCYGEPGPPVDWAFAWADGTYEISAPASCLPYFLPDTVYELTVDADAQSINISSDEGPVFFAWDDVDDASCPHPSAAIGMELTVVDDPGLECVTLRFSEEAGFERLTAWIGLPSGCVLTPAG